MQQNDNLLSLIESFAGRKILVIGEAMLDSYLGGTSERLCREAPVPVVVINKRAYAPGGAANTAVNLRSLGADVRFLSVIGDDAEGQTLLSSLEKKGVSTENVLVVADRQTLSKQRILAGPQIVVRFDQGTTAPVEGGIEDQLLARLEQLYLECDGFVISDYNYGIMTPRLIQALAELQQRESRLSVVDSRRLRTYRQLHVTAIKPNYLEAVQLLGLEKLKNDSERIRQIESQGRRILDIISAEIAAITLDQKGALVFHRESETPYRTYATPQPNSQAAGAGDTFISALTLSLATGAHVEHAAELASAAASIVVSKNGTAACFADELKEYFSAHEKFVSNVFQLAMRVSYYQRTKQRIVFTNGCFDILHRGHIAYLNRAKALGDILIVGLNSDRSVRKLKGPERPINSLEDRAQVLAALSCVDHIVAFDDDTPRELIRSVKPDIFVKGGDYTRETLPEASLVEELGGQVEILPYLSEYSTTSVIEKIRRVLARSDIHGDD